MHRHVDQDHENEAVISCEVLVELLVATYYASKISTFAQEDFFDADYDDSADQQNQSEAVVGPLLTLDDQSRLVGVVGVVSTVVEESVVVSSVVLSAVIRTDTPIAEASGLVRTVKVALQRSGT